MFSIEGHSIETMVELLAESRSSFRGFLSKWPLLATMRTNFIAGKLGPTTLDSSFQIILFQIIGISSVSRSL